MLHWPKIIRLGWLSLGLTFLLCLPATGWAVSPDLRRLERQVQQKATYIRGLLKRRQAHVKAVRAAARRLTFIKKQAQRPGFLGLPARLRLPQERAAAQRLVRKATRLNRLYNAQTRKLQALHFKLRKLYRKRMDKLAQQMKASSNVAKRKKLSQTWRAYRKRLVQLRASAPKIAARPIPRLRVNMDPLDGPNELLQKADILKDQQDRIKRRLLNIQRRIKRLHKKHQRESKDQKLAKRVDEMTSDDNLFNEGERNPRVTTGARTSERIRSRAAANANRLFGSSGQANAPTVNKGTTTDSANKAPSRQDSTASPPQAGAGSQGSESGDPKPGFSNSGGNTGGSPSPANPGTSKNGDDSSTPKPSNTNVRPNNTLQPRVNAPQAGDPLNPKGTLVQQIQALKRYQQALAKRAQQLNKKQGQFLKRAKDLQKKEQRRRRR